MELLLFIGIPLTGPGVAVDITPVLHSPFYWVMVAAILVLAGWLLKHWLHIAKP